MTFERILYVALRTDPDACTALGFLSKAKRAETRVIEEDEAVDTALPTIPITTYRGNGECRFPSKFLRAIHTDKENAGDREIPIPSFAKELSELSHLVVAIKSFDRLNPATRGVKTMVAIQNFHREQTGENLNAGAKTHRARKGPKQSIYKSGGHFSPYDF